MDERSENGLMRGKAVIESSLGIMTPHDFDSIMRRP